MRGILIFLFLTAALGACASPPRAADSFEERLVATLPVGVNDWWFTVSRDGSTWAYAERPGSEAFLVVGTHRYGPYP